MRLLFVAALLTLAAGCTDRDEDRDRGRILRRAKALRYLPLPNVEGVASAPAGMFVNTDVKMIRVETSPAGAEVFVRGKRAGTSPLEVAVADLLAQGTLDSKAPFAIECKVAGASARLKRYVLRFEGANFNPGIGADALPPALRGGDRFLYLELEAPR